jgi:hypothetical protein
VSCRLDVRVWPQAPACKLARSAPDSSGCIGFVIAQSLRQKNSPLIGLWSN